MKVECRSKKPCGQWKTRRTAGDVTETSIEMTETSIEMTETIIEMTEEKEDKTSWAESEMLLRTRSEVESTMK